MESWTISCRSCMKKAEVFSYFIYEHISPKDYLYCTSIEVKEDDDLPRAICDDCYLLLCQFINFKGMCIHSNEELLKYSKGLSIKREPPETKCKKYNDVMFEVEVTLEKESDSECEPVETWCNLKNVNEDAKEQAVQEKPCGGDNEGTGADSQEADVLQITTDLIQTIRVRKELEAIKKSRKAIRLQPKNHKCEQCNRKFLLQEHLDVHMLIHEGKTAPTECKICNKTYTTKWGLRHHIATMHTPYSFKDVTCQICTKVFKTPNTLRRHLKSHQRQERVCEECGKTLKNEVTYKSHLLQHIPNQSIERNFECTRCGEKFFKKKTLERHVARRHANNVFICNYCSYKFTEKSSLKRHIMIHEGTHPKFYCDICPRSFTSQAYLRVHKRMHTGEKPFCCRYCSKCFVDKKYLVEHERTHTGEKPFQCMACPLKFSKRSSWGRHMKVHNIEEEDVQEQN